MNILTALKNQERIASRRGDLEDDRAAAIDRYYGRPYGDETEGRSQVVMRDVSDTIEWIKPSLMKVFAAGDEVVRFDPVGPEDEQQAEQETDYCNHVLMSKNNGFLVLHDWFHDALLQRNGYVWVRAVERKSYQRERLQGLTDDELALVLQGSDTEVVEHQQTIDATGSALHDVAIRQTTKKTCIEVVNTPPERVLVAPDWPGVGLAECPFVQVIDYKTISQLREEGYVVDDKINDDAEAEDNESREVFRNIDEEEDRDDVNADPATRRVKVRYTWMNFDADGDGIAERHALVVVGDTILEDEEDDLIPVAALTPGRVPHEHIGQSVDDWVQDLQRIHTVLMRGFLDNSYMSMHPQTYVDTDRVVLDDLLTLRVGGIRRVKGDPRMAVMESAVPNMGPALIQAMEVIRSVRENRTGVTAYNQGMNADSLNKTAQGINQIMTASQQRIEMIARVFAETGVKALMLIIHAMSIKHGRQAELVRLRNKWIPVDPRGWKSRADLSVSVGIGTGNKDQMLQHLFMVLQEQKQAMAIGLAKPKNLYNSLRRLTQNAGFKQTEEFWTDPDTVPPQPPQPNPDMMRVQMDMQAKQADMALKQQQSQADIAFKQQASQIDLEKARVELQIKMADLELRRQELQLKAQEAHLDAQIAQQRAVMTASDDVARANQIDKQ